MMMNKDCLRTGDKANVRFRFIKHPEYIKIGQRMVFREGRTKAVGNILKPLYHVTSNAVRAKPSKTQQNRQNQATVNGSLTSPPPISAASSSSSNDGVKENLEFLEISTDKRDSAKSRGGKRKRGGPMVSSQNAENISAGSSSSAQ